MNRRPTRIRRPAGFVTPRAARCHLARWYADKIGDVSASFGARCEGQGMAELVDRPGLLLVVSFAGFLLAALLGVVAQRVWRPVQAGDQNELTIVQTAALTLLGLIVGFSFSMAVTRYDQRKNLEEAEANAIGTEYARADLMRESAAPEARELLKRYLNQRILFYSTSDRDKLKQIRAQTDKLSTDLWGFGAVRRLGAAVGGRCAGRVRHE
jgi:hypothetical protein